MKNLTVYLVLFAAAVYGLSCYMENKIEKIKKQKQEKPLCSEMTSEQKAAAIPCREDRMKYGQETGVTMN